MLPSNAVWLLTHSNHINLFCDGYNALHTPGINVSMQITLFFHTVPLEKIASIFVSFACLYSENAAVFWFLSLTTGCNSVSLTALLVTVINQK